MATKRVQILNDDAIKGVSYSAGQVAEFDERVAAAIADQKRGKIVSDETPLGAAVERPKKK